MRWTSAMLVLLTFVVGMAYVEAASVLYIRTLYGGIDPSVPARGPVIADYGAIEVGREAATMVMLLAVGWLAGASFPSRLGYFLVAFGGWDIAYYGWLAVFSGWPRTILDMDVLFLIPLPWWGPVLTPVLVAALMILTGGILVRREQQKRAWHPPGWSIALSVAGTLFLLYAFMEPAIWLLPRGLEEALSFRPTTFDWPAYLFGLVVAAVGTIRAASS